MKTNPTPKTLILDQKDYQNKLLNISYTNYQLEMKEYAKNHNVPIMQDEGIAFLISIIKLIKPKRILEIGAAIGYSSSFMALNSNAIIDTIEISPEMYELCVKNQLILGINQQVNVILGDALEQFDKLKDNNYDLIFIDAAKAQYVKFFNLYAPLLNKGGIILSDNLYFHNLLFEEINNRDLRQLVRKVDTYNQFLFENPNFETHIFKIGDGVGISIKK